MKLGAKTLDDVVALLLGEIRGQTIDGLNKVVRLIATIGGIGSWKQLEQWASLPRDDLEGGALVGGHVPRPQGLQDEDSSIGRGRDLVLQRNIFQSRRKGVSAATAAQKETAELQPDLLRILEGLHEHVIGCGGILALAGAILHKDDGVLLPHEDRQHPLNIPKSALLPLFGRKSGWESLEPGNSEEGLLTEVGLEIGVLRILGELVLKILVESLMILLEDNHAISERTSGLLGDLAIRRGSD